MKNLFGKLFGIGILLILTSCIYDPTAERQSANGSENSARITSLKTVIEDPNVKDGDTIDLSKSEYKDITDFNVTINKSLTIKNGIDLKDSVLTVAADGVVLNNIRSVSVTTNNSMKISSSYLSSLTLGGTGSSSSQNMISRSVDLNISVEVTDSTADNIVIQASVSLSLENTKSTKVEVSSAAANVQLTVVGFDTRIDSIEADVPMKLVLEDGASVDNDKITGSGTVSTITMTADDKPSDIIVKGLPTTLYSDQTPNFAGVSVIGSYDVSDDASEIVTILKPIRQYTIKIGNDVYYENGEAVKSDELEAKIYNVTITADGISQSEVLIVNNRDSGDATNPNILDPLVFDPSVDYTKTVFDLAMTDFMPVEAEYVMFSTDGDVTYDNISIWFRNATSGWIAFGPSMWPFTYQEIEATHQIICNLTEYTVLADFCKGNGTFIINISDDKNTIEILSSKLEVAFATIIMHGTLHGTFRRFPIRGRTYRSTSIIYNDQDISNSSQMIIEFQENNTCNENKFLDHVNNMCILTSSGSIGEFSVKSVTVFQGNRCHVQDDRATINGNIEDEDLKKFISDFNLIISLDGKTITLIPNLEIITYPEGTPKTKKLKCVFELEE